MTTFATEIIVAFLTGVLGPIVILLIRHYLEKLKKPTDMIREAAEIGNLISGKLDEIKEEVSADRVWVSQFHNGGHFYPTGKSIAKFSIFYEVVGAGVASIQSNFQNIPVNLFSKSINQLLNHDIIEIPDYKDENIPTYGTKYIAEDTGCKSSYLFAIKTIEGKYIGTMGVEFVKRKTKLDHETVSKLSNQATSIGGVLMNH
jgi:hypothetical protein